MIEWLEVIQTVGFPIVAFLLMFFLVKDTLKEIQKTVSENTLILRELKVLLARINSRGGE